MLSKIMQSVTPTPTPYVVLLVVADIIESDSRRYRFMEVVVPQGLHECGCVLGWVAYVLGHGRMAPLGDAARFLGYDCAEQFYHDLDRVWADEVGFEHALEHNWRSHADTCAQTLRALAREYRL